MTKQSLFSFTVALVSISVFLPMIASLFDEPLLKFVPLAVLVILNLVFLRQIKIEIDTFFFVVILSLFSSLNFWFAERNPLGLQIVILQGILFAGLFQQFSNSDLKKFRNFINVLFAFIIFIAFAEWVLILGGFQTLLAETLASSAIKGYKMTNSAAFVNWTWGQHAISGDVIYGANGPTLGSQGLSQLMLMSFFWFLPIQKVDRLSLSNMIMCSLAILGVSTCATMTVTITTAVIFCYLMFLDYGSRLNHWVIKLGLFTCFIFLGDKFFRVLFYRIRNTNDLNEYLKAYNLLPEFNTLSGFELLFGALNSFQNYSDFGLGSIAFAGGVVTFILIFAFLCLYCLQAHIVRRWAYINLLQHNDENAFLISLNAKSMIFIGVCFVGLIHYGSSIELGISQLFGMSLGLLFVSSKRLLVQKDVRKNNNEQVLQV